MATILKKVGLRVVEFDASLDSLEGKNLIINNVTYESSYLDGIGVNAGNITTNAGAISTNATAISTNVADIGTNLTAIGVNATDIATNVGDIGTNAGDIVTNAGDISTNAGAISTNAGDISTNAGAISTNAGAISTNTASISALASASTYGAAAAAISATDAPLEGGTIDLSAGGLGDDEAPLLLAADLPAESLIIFDGDTAPVVGKVGSVLGEVLTITYVGVTALEINKLYHVKYNLLASPGSEEVRTIYAMEAIDAAMVKVADEIWDSASGIGLGSFTSAAGAIDASDTVLSAIQKLDGNITASAPDLSGLVSKGGDTDGADLVIGTLDDFPVSVVSNSVEIFKAYNSLGANTIESTKLLDSLYRAPRLGSLSAPFNAMLYRTSLVYMDAVSGDTTEVGGINALETGVEVTPTMGKEIKINTVGWSVASGDITINTGLTSSGTVDSGDVLIYTGEATGVKGEVIITDVKYPTADKDAASKKYIDDEITFIEESTIAATVSMLSGEAFAAGAACYLKSDGKLYNASASSLSALSREDLEFIYVAETAATAADQTIEMVIPRTTIAFSGAVVGETYYLSDSVAGSFALTKPVNSGDDIVLLGRCQTADELVFSPVYLMTL